MTDDSESGKTKLERLLKRGPGSAVKVVLALREAGRPMLLTEIADLLGTSVHFLRTQTLTGLFELDVIEAIPDEGNRRRKRYRSRDLSVVDNRTESEKLRDKRKRSKRSDLL